MLAVFGVLASLYVAVVVVIKGFQRAASPEAGADITYQFIDPKGLPLVGAGAAAKLRNPAIPDPFFGEG